LGVLTIGSRELNLTAALRTYSFRLKIQNGDHKWLLKPEKKYWKKYLKRKNPIAPTAARK